ncbi:MAG: undecaprenyldiphospho-muramoylpentapeptide beta-N-acetylglucosaminyltransferase [Gammaproteobacteria bacterium]|nr:undecaprenyldiphospho-muramoylpentapeptide beta-N-acetylglucosaminyltransferase [Gammaproteobacteria bacterium]
MTARSILIVAGGTGGHIYPALAVAERLKNLNIGIYWLGSQHGIEGRIVPQHGFELSKIKVLALRGHGWRRWVVAPWTLAYATIQAIATMLRIRPGVVLGMGGFVSGPGGLAAWLCRVPLIIHEQNAVAGLTNRLIKHLATRVLAGYPQSFRSGSSAVVTGNPVRDSIATLPPPTSRSRDMNCLNVLVIGGSLGARRLNEVLPAALRLMPNQPRIQVWHQTGDSDLVATRAAYSEYREARVDDYIEDIAAAYGWADVVVCRAGAITVAELAASGVPSILIPFPHAVDDHQAANAAFLVDRGAAVMIRESELSAERLTRLLIELNSDRTRLLQMACSARDCALPNATNDVAARCLELINA